MIAPDPDHPDVVYGDQVDKLDTAHRPDAAMSIQRSLTPKSIIAAPGPSHSHSPAAAKERCTSPTSVSSGRLDGGDHWAPISPDSDASGCGNSSNLDAPTRGRR